MVTVIDDFFELVFEALQDEARQLDLLRPGVDEHTDFATLNTWYETWFSLVIFRSLYRQPRTYRVKSEPTALDSSGDEIRSGKNRMRRKLDLRLEDKSSPFRADFEIKLWNPRMGFKEFRMWWLNQIKLMQDYPRAHEVYLALLVRCELSQKEYVDSLEKHVVTPLNKVMATESIPARFALTHLRTFPHHLGSWLGTPCKGDGFFGVAFLRMVRSEKPV